MKYNFANSLSFTLEHEGGWSDDPRDPGGATMKGITIGTFTKYMKRPVTKDELKNITNQQLSNIYRSMYWDVCKCDELPSGLDLAVFDFAVNAGLGRAIKILQGVCGVERDGSIGPVTIKAAKESKASTMVSDYNAARSSFYRGLKGFPDFGKGWLRRVTDCEFAAQQMMG